MTGCLIRDSISPYNKGGIEVLFLLLVYYTLKKSQAMFYNIAFFVPLCE